MLLRQTLKCRAKLKFFLYQSQSLYDPSLKSFNNPITLVKKPLVFIDLETTSARSDASIREIGAIKTIGPKINSSFHALVKPKEGDNLEQYAKIISPSTQTFKKLIRFIGDSHLIAHNSAFDSRFLSNIYNLNNECDFSEIKIFCTYIIARKLLAEQSSFKLSALASDLKLTYPSSLKSHRALDDAFKTKLLWDHMMEYLEAKNIPPAKKSECLYNIQLHHSSLTSDILSYYTKSKTLSPIK